MRFPIKAIASTGKRIFVMKPHFSSYTLLFIILAGLLTSCVPQGVTRMDSMKHYVAVSPRSVKIFLDDREVPPHAEKVAIITNVPDDDWREIRRRCARVGANGVYRKFYTTGSRQNASDRIEYVAVRY
jgi:hypothetical protein